MYSGPHDTNGSVPANMIEPQAGILSDDEDVMEEQTTRVGGGNNQTGGVFSKFKNVCQSVFQSLVGTKQQREVDRAPEMTTRIVKRRSRQTLVPAGLGRKQSGMSFLKFDFLHFKFCCILPELVLNSVYRMESGVLPGAGQVSSNMSGPSSSALNSVPSSTKLPMAPVSELGPRPAAVKRGFTETAPTMLSSTPFKPDLSHQSYTAAWGALKQRRLEESKCLSLTVK